MSNLYKRADLRLLILCLGWLMLTRVSASCADTHTYMLLHNLGCRESNHTYSGFIPYSVGFDEGDLVEVILAGGNGVMDIPRVDGLPGGDDQRAINPGLPFAMNPESFTHYPNTFYSPHAILIQSEGHGPEPALHPGSSFYIRAWNGPSPAQSTMYYNSQTLTRDFPIGAEACRYPSGTRTLPSLYQIPYLISYAVTFDSGHPFAIPDPPKTVLHYDSSQLELNWETINGANSYLVEHSEDQFNWDTLTVQSDTFMTVPPDFLAIPKAFFRVSFVP